MTCVFVDFPFDILQRLADTDHYKYLMAHRMWLEFGNWATAATLSHFVFECAGNEKI